MAKKLLLAFLIVSGVALITVLAWFCLQSFMKQNSSVPAYFSSLNTEGEVAFDTDKTTKSAEVFSSDLTENFTLLKAKGNRASRLFASLKVLAPPPSLMDIDKGDYLPRIADDGTEPYNFYKAPFDYKKHAREAKLASVVT